MTSTRPLFFLILSLAVAMIGCGDDCASAPVDAGADADVSGGDYTTGAACTSDADCGSDGSGRCLIGFERIASSLPLTPGGAFNEIGLRIRSGYCSNTDTCVSDSDCGAGGNCYMPLEGASDTSELFGAAVTTLQATGICLQGCSADSECRQSDGYACQMPLINELSQVSDRPTDTYCVADQTPICAIDAGAVPMGKCHLEYALTGSFQITDTVGGQGDETKLVGPGVLILEVDHGGMNMPSTADGDVGVSCFYNDQRMLVANVFTAVEQVATGATPVATGTHAGATGIIDMTSNCAYSTEYGKHTESWLPESTPVPASGSSCLSDYHSYGDVDCGLGLLCSAGNLAEGHNPQDATWDQPLNNIELTAPGDWSALVMEADGGPDLWAPLEQCQAPTFTNPLAGAPFQTAMEGDPNCEDNTSWVDGMGNPIVQPDGMGGTEVVPGMSEEFECYRLHCIHPTDKVEIPNATPSRTFMSLSGVLVNTSCNAGP